VVFSGLIACGMFLLAELAVVTARVWSGLSPFVTDRYGDYCLCRAVLGAIYAPRYRISFGPTDSGTSESVVFSSGKNGERCDMWMYRVPQGADAGAGRR
jgi:hypothetical protein